MLSIAGTDSELGDSTDHDYTKYDHFLRGGGLHLLALAF